MSGLPHATSDLTYSPAPGQPPTKITVPWFAWVQKVERLLASVTVTATAAQEAAQAVASTPITIDGTNGVSASGNGTAFTLDGQADQHILAAQIFGR